MASKLSSERDPDIRHPASNSQNRQQSGGQQEKQRKQHQQQQDPRKGRPPADKDPNVTEDRHGSDDDVGRRTPWSDEEIERE